MKRTYIVLFVFLLVVVQSYAEEIIPFCRALNIGDTITISGELVVFNGWEPNIRFITDKNKIVGIGKDNSYKLSEEVNDIIQKSRENMLTNKITVSLKYIGDVSLPYYNNPLMCFSIDRIIQRVYLNEINTAKLGNRTIEIYQPNYNEKDLLRIGTISDGNSITCFWGINNAYIQKQKSTNEEELLKGIILNEYIENANYFIDIAYDNLWHKKLFLSSFSIETINKDDSDLVRCDWFLVFTYKSDINSEVENEKVFMLPNGAIILSSSNYENITYIE